MELYLLRHGVAEDHKPGAKDADRALTADGKKRLREVLQVAREAGVKPPLILTSPYRRARETAEIAREVLHPAAVIEPANSFVPNGEMRDAWAEIRARRDCECLLIASHEPFLSLFTAHLLNAPGMMVDFKKGGLVRIDVEGFGPQPRGVLRWMLTPRLASAMR